MGCALFNGEVYAAGGNNLNVVEIYDIAGNTWRTGTNMLHARNYFTMAVVNGELMVFGGNGAMDSREMLDSSGAKGIKSSMGTLRYSHASVVIPCM